MGEERVEAKNDGRIEVDGHVYTIDGGSAEHIRRGIAEGSFSGFRSRAEREAMRTEKNRVFNRSGA